VAYEHLEHDSAHTDEEGTDVAKILAQQISRLRVLLQDALGAPSESEKGSEAWLLLDALISS